MQNPNPSRRHVYNDTRTENAMPTHSTSGSYVLDMFYQMGGSRNLSEAQLSNMLYHAWLEDNLLTLKAVFYNRDVRGGQGERRSFRMFIRWLSENHPTVMRKNLSLVPYFGRWDDIFATFGTEIEPLSLVYIATSLREGDGLCAKWMPREGKRGYAEYGNKVRKYMGLTERSYRKMLADLTKVVETQMCENEWSAIKYEAVPSVAHNKYRRAFGRHDPYRYGQYIEKALKGEVKINAGAIFPHDIVRNILNHRDANPNSVQAQWNALPNYVPEGQSFIPVCDVSGSMSGLPMEVCISLGIYLSERNTGEFKDAFITFSAKPRMQVLKGNLVSRVGQLKTAHWDMNTDLEAVFKLILDTAIAHGLDDSELPKNILIISDMQFDQCVRQPQDNVFQMIRRMYEEAGYTLPQVIFWNLRTSVGTPVKYNQQGTAMVSGFSPSVMSGLLSGDLSPMTAMLKILNSERYSVVTL